MSGITTHVLDIALGKPAAGVLVGLTLRDGEGFRELGRSITDVDGRVRDFSSESPLTAATYQLVFETGDYFRASSRTSFYERVTLEFRIIDPSQHYHVPLLLSPFGYSTYRGS